MKIVTGYTGTPHISSNDDQARNQGIFGTGNTILSVGNRFNATLTNATTVTLSDGEGVMQGVHFRIEPGMTEAVSISPGTTGYNRIDLICARYTKDAGTGVESVGLVVVEGTPSTSTPTQPSYNTGNILNGDTLVDFPIWKVTLSGLTPSLSKMAYGSLIWTNPTPLTRQATYNISLDLSQYDYVDVWYIETTHDVSQNENNLMQRHIVGQIGIALQIDNSYNLIAQERYLTLAMRRVTVSTSGISFGSCYDSVVFTDNPHASEVETILVPYKIYGGNFK